LKDLYEQKDIHAQVIGKSTWVHNSRPIVTGEFLRLKGINVEETFILKTVLVTMHPSLTRFVEVDFPVMTIGELEDALPTLA